MRKNFLILMLLSLLPLAGWAGDVYVTPSSISKVYGTADADVNLTFGMSGAPAGGKKSELASHLTIKRNAGNTGETVGEYSYTLVWDGEWPDNWTSMGDEDAVIINSNATLEITKATFNDGFEVVFDNGDSYTYTGSALQPAFKVKKGSFVVPANLYTVDSWSANTNQGDGAKVTVKVTDDTNFDLSTTANNKISKTFTISKKSINGFVLTLSSTAENYVNETTPVTYPTVTSLKSSDNAYNLTANDYNALQIYDSSDDLVAAENLIQKGTYTAKVTGKGNFEGTATATFLIKGTSLDNAVVTIDGVAVSGTEATGTYVYTGSQVKPVVSTVKIGEDLTLNEGSDYTVSYEDNILATSNSTNTKGKAKITITGLGTYLNNTKTIEFTISQKNMSELDITGIDSEVEFKNAKYQPTTGVVKYGGITLAKYVNNSTAYDYTVSYGDNNTNATPADATDAQKASVTFTAKANGNYTGSKTVYFTITRKSISGFYFDPAIHANQVYKGAKYEPTTDNLIKWTNDANAAKLASTDYKVTYGDAEHDNTTVAKGGTVIIEGIGNYKDTKTLNFSIAKADLSVKAKDTEKIVGTADPTFELVYSGLVGSDIKAGTENKPADGVITGITIARAETGEGVGDHYLDVNITNAAGTSAGNYTITTPAGDSRGKLNIKASTTPLVLKVKNPEAQTYGSVNFAIANINTSDDTKAAQLEVKSGYVGEGTPSANDLKTLINLSGITFKYKDAAQTTDPTNAGTYDITIAGTATSQTYTNIQFEDGSFTINPFAVTLQVQPQTAEAYVDGTSEYTTPTAAQIATADWDATNAWVKLYRTGDETETALATANMPQVNTSAEFWKKDFIKSIDWVYEGEKATLGNPGQFVITLNDQFLSTNQDRNTNYIVTAEAADVKFSGTPETYTFDANGTEANAPLAKIKEYDNVALTTVSVKPAMRNGTVALAAEKWNTYVLPFATSVAELSKLDVVGYAVVNIIDEDNSQEGTVKFKLHMGNIPANTPFAMKTLNSLDGKTLTFGEATHKKTIVNAANADGLVEQTIGETGMKFVGCYKDVILTPTDGKQKKFAVNVNTSWRHAQDNNYTVKPFEAYLDYNGTAQAPVIIFEEADGTTTAINDIVSFGEENAKLAAKGWYTIDGLKLQDAPTQKGIYVKDGKKVIIK
ncbi:MAG: hypothetical protein IJ588_00800 [Prevotella sp.]|nr:hypothetical protein [Prevotella sp.]